MYIKNSLVKWVKEKLKRLNESKTIGGSVWKSNIQKEVPEIRYGKRKSSTNNLGNKVSRLRRCSIDCPDNK